MILSEKKAEVRKILDHQRASNNEVGMFGTNGKNHSGHLSVIRHAQAENDFVTVFWGGALKLDWGDGAMLDYDRNLGEDAALFEAAGVDLLFVPKRDDMFPRRTVTVIDMPEMFARIDGMPERRGMELVVTMFATFMIIVGPSRVYSGEKDWPQLAMFRQMAEDLQLPARLVSCPIEREDDGLAISSRNAQLTPSQRIAAPVLYRGLSAGVAAISEGERSARPVIDLVTSLIAKEAEADYVTIVDADTLEPREVLSGNLRLLGSAKLGEISIVDNLGVSVNGDVVA
ncbi:pantoate--beta-alanine ligase [Mycobacterium sp. MUNTM1]